MANPTVGTPAITTPSSAASLEHPLSLRTARMSFSGGAILYDPDRIVQAGPWLFEASYWVGDGQAGGRGVIFLVRGSFGDGVLRHYRRGGLLAHLRRDYYFYRGEERTRTFREFRLLQELAAEGLPVPRPLAAGFSRVGPFYRADLLTQRIAPARTFAECLPDALADAELMMRVGGTLARFHRAGVCHADLNAHNILIGGDGKVWLIDFDRGRRRQPAESWRQGNLARLQRSLLKLGAGESPHWQGAWNNLMASYYTVLTGTAR